MYKFRLDDKTNRFRNIAESRMINGIVKILTGEAVVSRVGALGKFARAQPNTAAEAGTGSPTRARCQRTSTTIKN